MASGWNCTAAVTAAEGTTAEVSWSAAYTGQVFVPAGSALNSLTFYTAPYSGGTFLALYTAAGSAVALTVAAGRSYQLPSELSGCRAFKMVGNDAGTVQLSFHE